MPSQSHCRREDGRLSVFEAARIVATVDQLQAELARLSQEVKLLQLALVEVIDQQLELLHRPPLDVDDRAA